MHPYPSELATALKLDDGAELELRPIRGEDADIEKEFVSGLSDRSMRLRFRGGMRTLSLAMVARFTQIDYDHEMAFVAVLQGQAREAEVGVCRYITLPDRETCEFAIVVGDAWQARGLGRRMMARLMQVAASRGVKTMMGFVAADNRVMLEMCVDLGFSIEQEPGDPQTRRVVVSLEGMLR